MLERCASRALRKARRGIRRACGGIDPSLAALLRPRSSQGTCGDGVVAAPELCDASAPANGGCPEGSSCIACLLCDARCGDGLVTGGEVCDPQADTCGAGEECVSCQGCGTSVPFVGAEEDVAPCAGGVGDRWTFEVEAGTAVTIDLDTVDAASAAKLAFEGACPSGASAPRSFRSAVGFPCTFTPPHDPNPGYGCPRLGFVAPASGSCSLTVGVFPRLDGGLDGCADPAIARYRLRVGGTALVLSGDDVPPGLLSD